MAKAQNVVQAKKKPSGWGARFRFFGRTLISNDACVEGRKKPWYAPLLIALLSAVIATAPTTYAYFTQSGGTLLDPPTYGLDNALMDFDGQMAAKGVTMAIQDNKLVHGETLANLYANSASYYGHYYDVTVHKTVISADSSSYTVQEVVERHCDFVVYYHGGSADDLSTFMTTILSAPANDPNNAWTTVVAYGTNAMFLGEDGFWVVKLPQGVTTSAGEKYYRWDAPALQGLSLASLATRDIAGNGYLATPGTKEAAAEHLASWKGLLNVAWDGTRISNGWIWTGITLASYVAIAFVLGLSVYLMTRGKKNPFSIYSFWDSQKIAYWASSTPALLTLLGFIPMFQSWAFLLYIFIYGMRIMWMSMRSLRPQYEGS